MKMDLDSLTTFQKAKKLVQIILDNGYEAYFVGGFVRDYLLNKVPHDFDITTSANVETIISLFNKEFNVIETGRKHGTITVVINGESFEITTFRKEGYYKDGRHPEFVTFDNVSLLEDLSRRDFTINAIAMNINKEIIDPFNGIKDIDNRIIRTVNDPLLRFEEDHLRVLRALRFSTSLDFEIDETTKEAIKKISNKRFIDILSKERIRDELNKILISENTHKIAQIFNEFKEIFVIIIPELEKTIGFNQFSKWHKNDVYQHTINVLINTKSDLETRLAALFHDIGKVDSFVMDKNGFGHFYGHSIISERKAIAIMKRLKYPNTIIENVSILIKEHDSHLENKKNPAFIRLIGRLNKNRLLFQKLIDLKAADSNDHTSHTFNFNHQELLFLFDEALRNETISLKDLKINGNDLIAIGINKGEKIGFILKKCLEAVIDGSIKNNKEDLLDFINKSLIN